MSEFEAIASVGTLRKFTAVMEPVVTEATVEFREGSVYAEVQDPANVALTNQSLDASAFESYHAERFRIGLNLERFDELLSSGQSDALAHLSLNDESRKIDIDLPDASFSMAGIDPDSVRTAQTIDELGAMDPENLTADVEMDGAAFEHGITVVGMVSDHLAVESDPDGESPLRFIGEGDTDEATVPYQDSLHEGSSVDEASESLYSHEYLSELAKPIPKDATVRLRTGDEWPMRIDYDYAEGAGDVSSMCAPRIQKR